MNNWNADLNDESDHVDILSPFEMIRLWSMEKIIPPCAAKQNSALTAEGRALKARCKLEGTRPEYRAGIDYEALEAEDRILMPNLPALGALRHQWCWERRSCPHLPVWSFAKVPSPTFSPEENCRLLSVFMRPWTLDPSIANRDNPLMSELGTYTILECFKEGLPGAAQPPNTLQKEGTPSAAQEGIPGAAQSTSARETEDASSAVQSPNASGVKKRRVAQKTPVQKQSYAATWELYANGNVLSPLTRRYIINLLAATSARVVEVSGDSSDDSDAEQWAHLDIKVGDMDVIRRCLDGIGAHSQENGTKGLGRHAAAIRIGRDLWQSAPLSESTEDRIVEDEFSAIPAPELLKKAVAKIKKADDVRPQPFTGQTLPFAHLAVIDYGKRIDDWFRRLAASPKPPNVKQWEILQTVKERVLVEFRLFKQGSDMRCTDEEEEPLRGFIQGPPGTGKSRLIRWIRDFFTEALGWEHGVEFVFVAFQNRVAYAMGGTTLHAGGDIQVGGQTSKKLNHTDLDILFIRNQQLRWVIADEAGMIPDDLLGAFASHYTDATLHSSRYRKRSDGSLRIMGGYNLMSFGDLFQLPPIPASAAIFIPPQPRKTEQAKAALNIFWGDDADSLNYFRELDEQMRLENTETWYGRFLDECREGVLTHTNYCYLTGLPTKCAGSTLLSGITNCGNPNCDNFAAMATDMICKGFTWTDITASEAARCGTCARERIRRNRLVDVSDERTKMEPFLSAPYINRNNRPKYHATFLRAEEWAKKRCLYRLWFFAQDTPCNPRELGPNKNAVAKKLTRFLTFHEQETAGLPGLNMLCKGLPVRMTEKIVKNSKITILKQQSGTIYGWILNPNDKRVCSGQRQLNYLPRIILVKFEGVDWQVDGLPIGVFPLAPVERTWCVTEGDCI